MLYSKKDNLKSPHLDSPPTRNDILSVGQDLMVLHSVAFGLFMIVFVLLVVKLSFMVTTMHQEFEMMAM